jgi:hypothetical protein
MAGRSVWDSKAAVSTLDGVKIIQDFFRHNLENLLQGI